MDYRTGFKFQIQTVYKLYKIHSTDLISKYIYLKFYMFSISFGTYI